VNRFARFDFAGFALWTGLCVLLGAFAAGANPFEETIDILENRTVFHWGRDCLVWVVHYPEELVEPWVEAEAGRAGMTESEREAYRKGFVSELAIGAREPFLVTVYAFGPRPLSFSPLSENVSLVTSGGERFKPVRYDKALDQPVNGIVQGLIFFPKQKGREFSVAIRGMGVRDECLFSFRESPPPLFAASSSSARQARAEEDEVVVLELPPKPSEPPKARVGTPPRQEQRLPKEIARPPLPPAPPRPSAPALPAEPEGQSMAEFVEAMRSGDRGAPPPAKKAAEQAQTEQSQANQADQNPALSDSAYVSREKTVRDFLSLWTKNDPAAMYSMLSKSSRKLFSEETFESDLRKTSDFRAALRDGYRLEWLGTERARVVAARRILLVRTLVSRTLGVVREGTAWKIVW
jgi:hypothetical protein